METVEQLVFEEVRDLNHYESQSGRLSRKLKENPFFGIGLLGMTAVCAAGAYRFRRGPLPVPISQYLMQLRVTAQGACVSSLVVGVAYTMYKREHIAGAEVEDL